MFIARHHFLYMGWLIAVISCDLRAEFRSAFRASSTALRRLTTAYDGLASKILLLTGKMGLAALCERLTGSALSAGWGGKGGGPAGEV